MMMLVLLEASQDDRLHLPPGRPVLQVMVFLLRWPLMPQPHEEVVAQLLVRLLVLSVLVEGE